MAWSAVTYVGVLAGVLALSLAAVVLRASSTRSNRWLAALLAADGLLQGFAVLNEQYEEALPLMAAFLVTMALAPALALVVLAPLQTPAVAWLRRRGVLPGAFVVAGALVASIVALIVAETLGRIDPSQAAVGDVIWISLFVFLAAVYIFSFVASISAFRRAEPGTHARTRAKAFAVAFGARDVGLATFLLLAIVLEAANMGELAFELDWFPALATIAYVLLLAYGILRTQLFDIDLKIKVGISRSTVVTLGLVAVLGAAKVAEFYLSKTYGLVAGGIAAGVMLVLAPRLNRIGDKVASAALPRVSDSAEYVGSRKIEVYRAAVEVAWEDGALSMQDRAILDRLREKLEITGAEAFEVEDAVGKALRRAVPGAGAAAQA